MPELLLEVFSEEIPASAQDYADRLRYDFLKQLRDAGLQPEEADASNDFDATPRRLAIRVAGVRSEQSGERLERKGPRVDAPAAAIEGFKRGLPSGWLVEERPDAKGLVLFAIGEKPSRSAANVLSELIPATLGSFPWPRSMRWAARDERWVRPIQAIVCLFDGEIVPFEFAGIKSGQTTYGHRFHAPASISVASFDDYCAKLSHTHVILGRAERRALIAERAAALAAGEGLRVRDDAGLLDELKGLVEWPVPLMGRIDDSFMELPAEVLVTSMRQHQKYLAVENADGTLAPFFITVANIEAPDGGAAIIAGNERVLRARLWDARFFWSEDRKTPLVERLPALDAMVFHAALGTLGEKVQRNVALAGAIAGYVKGADRALAERAALLAKCDLVTGMVGEFPELQGVMGGYYATAQGEAPQVALAIKEHYKPQGPDDARPIAPESVVLALADKLDTLVGFFAAGIRPTGSKDPFALRRSALGIIRIIVEHGVRAPLRTVISAALAGYGDRFAAIDGKGCGEGILEFLADRLKVHLRGEATRHDLVSAVFAVRADDDLVRLKSRTTALSGLVESAEGVELLAAYRRAGNIVRIEEKRDGVGFSDAVDPSLLVHPAEVSLWEALAVAEAKIAEALKAETFVMAMRALAELRAPVDRFFADVTVNADDPGLRANRLRLLGRIRSALGTVADFSLIEGAGARVG